MTRGLASASISFREEADEILNDTIPSLEQSQEDLVAEAKAEYGGYAETPPEYEKAYERMEQRKVEARGEANALARFIASVICDEDWADIPTEAEAILADLPEDADAVFTVQELTGGQLAMVEDDVAEASFEVDMDSQEVSGTPKSGYGRVLSCKHAIQSFPDECPTDDEGRCAAGDFSHQVQDFLFERINSLNTVGDTNMGNSSLREAMATDGS